MKFGIVYSSLTGCTKRVAEALYAGLDQLKAYPEISQIEKSIDNFRNKPDVSDADIVALGYFVSQASMEDDLKKFLPNLKGKRVFVFCTLAYFAESEHAFKSIQSGVNLVKAAGAEVIGSYVCNGALAPDIIARFKSIAESKMEENWPMHHHHAFTPEKGLRYELFKKHPTKLECELASERFNERVILSEKILNLHK